VSSWYFRCLTSKLPYFFEKIKYILPLGDKDTPFGIAIFTRERSTLAFPTPSFQTRFSASSSDPILLSNHHLG